MKTKNRLVSIFVLLSILFLSSGCGCRQDTGANYRISLEVWGFLDDRETLDKIFNNYKGINRRVAEIKYKKISTDTYKKELIDALASGQGPDVFLIHNTWLPGFSDKIVSAPEMIFNEQKLRKEFVDVAANDFLKEGKVYAVPLSVDSLGLYYNKDLFNQAGITTPPKTWTEFLDATAKITKLDSSIKLDQIKISGAALGTAYNINRSTDVLTMLMLQNETRMNDEDGQPTFDKSVVSGNSNVAFLGQDALSFYTSFADISKANYSWNMDMHYSIDAFSEQTTAMMFNYSWHIDTIREKSPKLNFAVAEVPQFAGKAPANYANYWGYAVANNKISKDFSKIAAGKEDVFVSNDIRIAEAWNFVTYLTSKIDPATVSAGSSSALGIERAYDPNFDPGMFYAKETGRPGARRDVIEMQKTDAEIGAFAYGNLIAKSWYQKDPEATEAIFAEMINQVNRGAANANEAIRSAVRKVEQQGRR